MNLQRKPTDYWFHLKVHLLSVQQCIQMLDHECLHMFVTLRSVSITRSYCPLRSFGLFSKLVETTSAGGPIDIIIVTKCCVAARDSNCSINSTTQCGPKCYMNGVCTLSIFYLNTYDVNLLVLHLFQAAHNLMYVVIFHDQPFNKSANLCLAKYDVNLSLFFSKLVGSVYICFPGSVSFGNYSSFFDFP